MKVSEATIDMSSLAKPAAHGASDSSITTATRILDTRCLCGEGILFDDRTSTVMFVDIDGKTFHTLKLNAEVDSQAIHTLYELPKKMGSFGMLQAHKEGTALPLLCAWEDGFQIYDVITDTELSAMSLGPDVNPAKNGSRLNDGRTDPAGNRFICGGYFGEMDHVTMQLFKVEQCEKDHMLIHEPIMDGIQVANALCWSLDGSRMYFADSPRKEISSFAYDKSTGTLSDQQLLRQHEPSIDHCVPDGSCVDSEGYLWNATFNWGDNATGLVHRIHPTTGDVVYTVQLPDGTSQVTCCCFGGESMDTLFITTAAKTKQDQQPHAGALYAAKVSFNGQKEARLNFKY